MRRLLALSFGILLLAGMAGSSAVVHAATKTIMGKVTAVTADSVTVSGKEGEWKLVVDSKTTVVGRGLGTKAKEMKGEQTPTQVTDFLKSGDEVSAKYDDVTKHAQEIRVTKPVEPPAPKK
jgi:2-keto-4-pentenoate hydratase/2-oxohepta-3-ene-1,7-dioic acid hydratase in catechol pathway